MPPSLIHRWLKVFPHPQYDTNYGLSEPLRPRCVHLAVGHTSTGAATGTTGVEGDAEGGDERTRDGGRWVGG